MDDPVEIAEAAFLTKLAELKVENPSLIIDSSPDDPDAYDAMGAAGCLLVRYQATNDKEPPVKGPPSQRAKTTQSIDMHVFVGSRSFKGKGAHIGAYRLLFRARQLLTGLGIQVAGNEQSVVFFPAGAKFFAEFNGVWWYVQRMRSTEFRSP